jgi:hypothetical protein
MSKGNDGRTAPGRDAQSRATTQTQGPKGSSRSSVRMTPERARAIQAHADRTGTNGDFKARAMSAAAANRVKPGEGEE